MTFNATLATTKDIATITLSGELDATAAPLFKQEVTKAAPLGVQKLVLLMKDLEYMASAGLRVLIFAKQKMGKGVDIYLISPQEMVLDTIKQTGFHHSVIVMDEFVS
ncbi:anti-sigma factor antagonist [Pleurocapsa sp. PCC 7319]|uniref:anti-sigma factor antagonist n=1 Tax=Pleurocapsa sp. PCC 7319 TaxID=118161 RepID=UPI000344DF49|nr:anti-sigma factor antagonist [Pleurocapsa sp. PCC 7319]